MKVVLAGYNIDTDVIEEARRAGVASERLTPEVLSAAYARISRDPRPVSDLRKAALEEVEKARGSNRKIIFEMGHHSVAEHAVFNFDVLGVSRLAIEALEHFRLCSFTEKSQRYITLGNDFVVPDELRGTPYENDLNSMLESQAMLYDRFNSILRELFSQKNPHMEKNKAGRRLLDGSAKEDARYVTLLATTGQLGLTANARNLELIIRRFNAADLSEVRNLGKMLCDAGSTIAPSLLLFTDVTQYDQATAPELAAMARDLMSGEKDLPRGEIGKDVSLKGCTPDGDRTIAAAMLHSVTSEPFDACLETARRMPENELVSLFKTAMHRMEFFDSPLREFEHASLTFEVIVSASCYAQLKRHRITTQSVQEYDPDLGITVPPSIAEAGLDGELKDHASRAEDLFRRLKKEFPAVAPYALTNAHRRRVVVTANLRDMYHLIRLREDAHAQWDIRGVAAEMRRLTEQAMPLGSLLLCGKDSYQERYEKVFGRRPKIKPPDA